MLAKKELLRFAATVRNHICCGKPNDEHNKQTQTAAMDNNVNASQQCGTCVC